MFTENSNFETWMKRIMERFDRLESRLEKGDEKGKQLPTIDGGRLYDNQDLCLLFNICRRTLQRYRSVGGLAYSRIDQKVYYREADVKRFIEERASRKKKLTLHAV
jgi:hypothetical protein